MKSNGVLRADSVGLLNICEKHISGHEVCSLPMVAASAAAFVIGVDLYQYHRRRYHHKYDHIVIKQICLTREEAIDDFKFISHTFLSDRPKLSALCSFTKERLRAGNAGG